MLNLPMFSSRPIVLNLNASKQLYRCFSLSSTAKNDSTQDPEDFRVLNLRAKKWEGERRVSQRRGRGRRAPTVPPRYTKMPVDQDWASVWPTAKTFHPASVPLPVRQGFVKVGQAPPGKFGNAELMKIPNFLHLTPPAIERHCAALKKFCTEWPKGLETEEQMEKHFPVHVTTSDYCHSSPTIRDPKSRIVTMKVKLSALPLDEHARDKLLRLVKERYDRQTDELTFVAERCPLQKQNKDYAYYLLNVLVSESRKREAWEEEKAEVDMEKYVWEGSQSESTLLSLVNLGSEKFADVPKDPEAARQVPKVREYAASITDLLNKGKFCKVLK
nr:EOG090X09BG [Eulimnadia texana]